LLRSMCRTAKYFLAVLFVFSPLFSQTQIDNPEKPKSRNAGRTVKLEEVLQIRDVGDEYYFQAPYNVKISPEGFIFVQDVGQLLQFDQEGQFIRNFFKKGQGPGEVSYIRNYLFSEKNVLVHCPSPNKLVWFDSNGELIDEFRIEQEISGMQLEGFRTGDYIFSQFNFPRDRGASGIIDIPHNLYGLLNQGKKMEKWGAFPVSYYLVVGKSGAAAIDPINSFTVVQAGEKFMVVNHTSEYRMTLFDIEKQNSAFEFSRKYKRVKTPADYERKGGATIDGKPVIPPRPKFLNDIDNIFVHEENIWVLTSTVDKEKGSLIDVFDFEGAYIDNIYLNIPINLSSPRYRFKPVTYSGGFFYFIETMDDDTYVIKKYRLLNN